MNVKNLGSMAAQEVVQLYSWPQSDERARVLRAFDKTGVLAPEAEEFTHLCVQQRDMASWEEGQWALRAGTYTFGLCKDAGSVLAIAAMVDVPGTIFWKP